MRRLRHLGGSPLPYLLGLTLFPVCAWISRWATSAFWHDVEFHASVSDWRIGIASAIPLCLFPGFAEEFGWRGFLQPHLQQRWNPALSSAVVGIVWWLWHGLSIGVEPQKYAGWGFLLFGAYIVPTSVLIGSIVERAGGSLPVAIVAHFGANIVNFYIPMSDTSWMVYFGSLWLGAVSIGIAAARRARRKSDHDPWPCNTEISGSFDSSRPDA